jgi:hypothetical protein
MNRNKKTKNIKPGEAIDYVNFTNGVNDVKPALSKENVNNKKKKNIDFSG